VLESRSAAEGAAMRRRRECSDCGRRFTTYERYERGPLSVRKRDGSSEEFDSQKLLGGLLRAAHKRPVQVPEVEAVVDRIEAQVEAAGGELDSRRIGELALRGLRHLDPVAYVRFASVYNDFGDLAEFEAELHRLEAEPPLQEAALFEVGEAGDRTGSVRLERKDAQLPVEQL
jgi:transcriptional repressor NrdR